MGVTMNKGLIQSPDNGIARSRGLSRSPDIPKWEVAQPLFYSSATAVAAHFGNCAQGQCRCFEYTLKICATIVSWCQIVRLDSQFCHICKQNLALKFLHMHGNLRQR
ncbi:hypothetical protein B0H12DRAFT_1114324 [Mycena haematopus]|nr:hypothetical protein B0H12DRAFT_1162733 [Mycena haematopus]KAJ7245187.1 hypothetical protein B0H12DRAFT_1128063 [Mycena haematopus]KAJ7254960.1 hypothetical protein B0H12DRAFT_1114324 [Mycena haematopus]